MAKRSAKGYNIFSKEELESIYDKIKGYDALNAFSDGSGYVATGVGSYGISIQTTEGKELFYTSGGWPNSTNNRGELWGLTLLVQIINEFPGIPINVYSDSMYSLGVFRGNKGNANKDLLEKARAIKWHVDISRLKKVKAHGKGDDLLTQGNNRADELAGNARILVEEELRKNKKTISEKQQSEMIGELEATIFEMRDEIIQLKTQLEEKCPKSNELTKYKLLYNKITSENYMYGTSVFKIKKFAKELGI